jgi:tetratricopeptide (TPR) repeat protein
MTHYNARLSAAILGVGFALVQVQSAQALTKVEVSKIAQSVTVMIQNAQNPQNAGSGVIIKREGEVYTVLTAHHVVQRAPDYKVMTPDAKLYPMVQGSVKPFPGVDLALLQFKSGESYSVAKIGDSDQSSLGSTSFVAGFPGTTAVSSEPTFLFTSGKIAANASRPLKDGYAIAYNNSTLPGMSGGPVLNAEGKLIGIHGRAEAAERLQNSQVSKDIYILKTEFNYAIPINTFLRLAPQVNSTLAFRTPTPSVSSTPRADDFLLQAEAKYKKGDKEGAIADYDQAIRLDPTSAENYSNRGFIRNELGYKMGAIADYDQAIRINPKSATAYNNRGNIRYELGDEQGVMADYDQAIQIDPKSAIAYNSRGFLRKRLGDKQGAMADLDQAIRLDPKYAAAYNNRGNVRYQIGDKQGAILDIQKAADLFKSQGDKKSYQEVLKSLSEINNGR